MLDLWICGLCKRLVFRNLLVSLDQPNCRTAVRHMASQRWKSSSMPLSRPGHWYRALARHLEYFGKMRFSYVIRQMLIRRHSGSFFVERKHLLPKRMPDKWFWLQTWQKISINVRKSPFPRLAVFEKSNSFVCVCAVCQRKELLLRSGARSLKEKPADRAIACNL